MSIQIAEQTSLTSYRLVYTGDGTDTIPADTDWPIDVTSGDIDLHAPEWGGKGTETKANRLCFLFLADQAGAAVVEITGACQKGPEEYIASLAITSAGCVESGENRWVSIIAVTPYHLSEDCILAADNDGDNRPAKFGFDAIGYQFISFYTSSFGGGMAWLKIYARYF